MVTLMETTRENGVPFDRLDSVRTDVVEEYQKLLNEGAKILINDDFAGSEQVVRTVEEAYGTWRSMEAALSETLSLAYDGTISRQNLLLDDCLTELRRRIGDPIASLYTRLHALWTGHLEDHPWDAHLAASVKHADADRLAKNINSLVHGDHLDVEDALANLTGPLRYSFAEYIEHENEPLDVLEESLWMRPEIVLIHDYWQYHTHVRLIDLIRRKSRRKYAQTFEKIQSYFSDDNLSAADGAAERIVADVRTTRPESRDTFLRCLMLHPNQEIRRYAVTNVDIDGFWKTVTPEAVPLGTILSMLETVSGSNRYDEDFQKVFYRAIHKRLLNVGSRSELLYARGIVRILIRMPFFMEDSYFEKLMIVVDYLGEKEKRYGVADGVLDGYVEILRETKEKTGSLASETPNIAAVPAVVLRKLARDGHFWYELSTHPLFKVARETIAHINSPERAVRAATNNVINQDVLRAIGKKRSLFGTRSARIALLSNPRTPPAVSLGYIADLSKQDKEQLLRRSTVHPELRRRLIEHARV
jgi:hypothetical protein